MASSTFNITDDTSYDTLTLVVRPDGTITPDKEKVKEILGNRQSMDIDMMTMKKVESGEVDVILDKLTYINSDTIEDTEEMTEIERNLFNFRMDHDYTPFTLPTEVTTNLDMVDELAKTLSMLEDGSIDPQVTNEPLTKITKIVNGRKQTIFVNSKEKQRMINAGLLKEKPSEKVFKKPKPIVTVASPTPVVVQSLPLDIPPLKPLSSGPIKESELKDEKKVVVVSQEMIPTKQAIVSSPTDKKPKKIVKAMPDISLFSTPDIIRRISKDSKEPTTPEKDDGIPKPAKISPDSRSKSNTSEKKRMSTDEKPRRLSLDNNKPKAEIPEFPKPEIKPQTESNQVSVQDFSETLSNSNESITDDQLEPMPSAEDIRAMIHSENTKSFTMNTIFPEPREDNSNMNLDASLDLDQSILDDINTDLISEDILYQVAQSLVDNNTELQNVIDKSITEGNLDLDTSTTALENTLDDSLNVPAATDTNAVEIAPLSQSSNSAAAGATQILRPGGRVVVIPPIERPTTRSRNRRVTSNASQTKSKSKPLDDQHVSGEELDSDNEEQNEDDDDDDEVESDDDPNKLWCICNQPHNNRFMICCDTCEEWYHGKCVNVTKAMGQTMEAEGKEWMCIYCKDPTAKRPAAAMRRLRKASRTSTESSVSNNKAKQSSSAKKSSGSSSSIQSSHKKNSSSSSHKDNNKKETEKSPEKKPPGCVVCNKPCRNSSIYCSDACILKHAQGVEKVVVYNKKTGQLLSGSNAPTASNLDKWLAENPSYEVVRSSNKSKSNKPPSMTQTKLKIIKNSSSPGSSLAVQKKGVNVGVIPHGPKQSQSPKPQVLNSSMKTANKSSSGNTPSSKVVTKQSTLQVTRDEQPKLKMAPTQSQNKQVTSTPKPKVPPPQKKEPTPQKKEIPPPRKESTPSLPQKTPKARVAEVKTPKQENLRDTVKKTFFEQLSNRLKNVDDLKLSDDELRQVSDEIESQLYKCFADTGQKYRNKYRSLIFNIKDPKNQTLWRRICEKSVNPYQLVRLSHDDLASQELALWRERETKHQLDMIKKSELELLNCSRQYVFKTHKGETVFEDDRAKDQVTDVLANPVADTETEQHDTEDSKSSSSKHSSSRHRKSSRDDNKHRSKSRDRKKRSRSRDRSSRHSDRRKSRSRDRDRHRDRDRRHKSSRHKKEEERSSKTINTEKLDKKSKEILEQLVDKHIVPPLEDKMWKQEEIVQAPPIIPAAPVSTESDSDHEPSSTVTIPTPPRVPEPDVEPTKKTDVSMESTMEEDKQTSPEDSKSQESLWHGEMSMVDVANVAIKAYEVAGDCVGLGDELPRTLEIVGRIAPNTVWDYIGKMKASNSKSISVVRLSAQSNSDSDGYHVLYNYLSTRQRLGVVKGQKFVKDFYILPLDSKSTLPDVVASIPTTVGLEEDRPAMLIGVIVRGKWKRKISDSSTHSSKRVRVEIKATTRTPGTPPPASTSRSYTPPPTRDPRVKLPVPLGGATEENEEDMNEPYSPADSDPDTAQEAKTQMNTADLSNLLTGAVKASSFLDTSIAPPTGILEPFANKFDGIPGLDGAPVLPSNSLELEQKMALLDQEIAAQKAEIDKVSKDLVYSGNADIEKASLANISIPSNLQQILESIKCIGNKSDTPEYQPAATIPMNTAHTPDLTIPLMLPKLSSRSVATASPVITPEPQPVVRKEPEKSTSVLSSLSEEELIKKAAEMLAEVEPPPQPKKRLKSPPPRLSTPPPKKGRLEMNQPPIPGLED